MEADWRLLIEFDYPHVSKDFLCILCEKILYDARISPCECRFCAECIETYLHKGNANCPGQSEDCRDVILNLSENISKDHAMNRTVARMHLKCPVSKCLFNHNLVKVTNHLVSCSKLAIRCPYFEQGCKYTSLAQDDIDTHLELQRDKHLTVMVAQIKALKETVEACKAKSKSWKGKLQNAEDVNVNLENELRENEKEIHSKKQTEKDFQKLQVSFLEIQNKLKQSEVAIRAKRETEKELQDLKRRFHEVQNEMDDLKNTMKNTWGALSKPFIWKCPNKDSVYQHSDQYCLYPSGPWMLQRAYFQGDYWEICVFMVKGDLNRKRPFPIKCIITISISNTHTGLALVKDDSTKIFSSDTDVHKFVFNRSDVSNNGNQLPKPEALVIECSVRITE